MEQGNRTGNYTGARAVIRNNPEEFRLRYTSGVSMEALGEFYNTTEGGARQLCVFAKKMRYITEDDSSVRRSLAYKSKSNMCSVKRESRRKEIVDRLGSMYDLYCLICSKTELCNIVGISYSIFDKMFPDYEEVRKNPAYLEENIYIGLSSIKHIQDFKLYDSAADDEVIEFPFTEDRRRGFKEALSMLNESDRDIIISYFGDKVTLEWLALNSGVSIEQVRRRLWRACRRLLHPTRFRWIKYGYAEKLRRDTERKTISTDCMAQGATIDALNLSVRAYNVLVRARAKTVDDVKLLIQTGHIFIVRNMGRRSAEEVMGIISKIDQTVKCPYTSYDEFIRSDAYSEWQVFINKHKLGQVSYGYYYIANVDYLREMIELNSK